jgi:hypothetical protein
MTKQIKSILTDIEPKKDKNLNHFYKLSLQGLTSYFYAFNNLPAETLNLLKDTPHQLVHQPVLITYEELPNKNNQGTFYRVKAIERL